MPKTKKTAAKSETAAAGIKMIETPKEKFSLVSRLLFHLKENKTKEDQKDEEKIFTELLDKSRTRRKKAENTLSDLANAVFFVLNEMEDESLLYLVHRCRQSMEGKKDCEEMVYISRGIEPIISTILWGRSRNKEVKPC